MGRGKLFRLEIRAAIGVVGEPRAWQVIESRATYSLEAARETNKSACEAMEGK